MEDFSKLKPKRGNSQAPTAKMETRLLKRISEMKLNVVKPKVDDFHVQKIRIYDLINDLSIELEELIIQVH